MKEKNVKDPKLNIVLHLNLTPNIDKKKGQTSAKIYHNIRAQKKIQAQGKIITYQCWKLDGKSKNTYIIKIIRMISLYFINSKYNYFAQTMALFNSVGQVSESIQRVLEKGGDILFNRYLDAKLPEHCNTLINNTIIENNSMNFVNHQIKGNLKIQKQPQRIGFDSLEVQKLKSKTYKVYKKDPSNVSSGTEKKRHLSSQDNKKYSCFTNINEKDEDQLLSEKILRKQRFQRGKMKLLIQKQISKKKEQHHNKRKKMQMQLQQLTIKGNSFTFDYDNTFIQVNNNISNHSKRVSSLKYKTIDLGSSRTKQLRISNISGKRIGFYQNSYKRKSKLNDCQYNNNGSRQISTIPFMTLMEGTKIIQPIINVVAHKRRSNSPNRYQYQEKVKNINFRSYIQSNTVKLDIFNNTATLNTSRPNTTNYTSGKNTAQTSITRRSILWRPQKSPKNTSSTNHKIKVNKNLADELIKS